MVNVQRKRLGTILMCFSMFVVATGIVMFQQLAVNADGGVEINEVNFPDVNFRKLVSSYYDDNDDGLLNQEEIADVHFITISESDNVTDLTGIKYFTSIEYVDCSKNPIKQLDLSGCSTLKTLQCSECQITQLNIQNCENLESVYCDNNQLSTLCLSDNTKLQTLYCSGNLLETLEVQGCSKLRNLGCSANRLKTIDLKKNQALNNLECSENPRLELDVKNNYALVTLGCVNCDLDNIDLSNNTLLKYLNCSRNYLQDINLRANTMLEELNCSYNQLKTLSLANNGSLKAVYCNDNLLTSLSMIEVFSLNYLYCFRNNISEIDLSDNTALVSLSCEDNKLTDLHLGNNIKLESLHCSNNQIKELDLRENVNLEVIDCRKNNIQNLLVNSDKLLELRCSNNSIKKLDVGNCPLLKSLVCFENQLSNIDLTHNLSLQKLHCQINSIADLDISNNVNLQKAFKYGQCVDYSDEWDEDTDSYWYSRSDFYNYLYNGFELSVDKSTVVKTSNPLISPTVIPTKKPVISVTPAPTIVPSVTPKATVSPTVTSAPADQYDDYTDDNSDIVLKYGRTAITNMVCGDKIVLDLDTDDPDTTIKWKSSNPSVASVSKSGKVTAKMAGSVTITSSAEGKKAYCVIQILYKDVKDPAKFWYSPTNYLTNAGVVKGYDKQTKFKPANMCTRAQMVTFIWRLEGCPEPDSSKCKFSDVKKKDYFYKACIWGNENHIVEGYKDGTFGPQIVCARKHAVTFLWRLAGKPAPSSKKNKFSDVKKKDYFYKATLWASEMGILAGYSDGTFKPDGDCLRRQMVTFLYKYDKFVNGKG